MKELVTAVKRIKEELSADGVHIEFYDNEPVEVVVFLENGAGVRNVFFDYDTIDGCTAAEWADKVIQEARD